MYTVDNITLFIFSVISLWELLLSAYAIYITNEYSSRNFFGYQYCTQSILHWIEAMCIVDSIIGFLTLGWLIKLKCIDANINKSPKIQNLVLFFLQMAHFVFACWAILTFSYLDNTCYIFLNSIAKDIYTYLWFQNYFGWFFVVIFIMYFGYHSFCGSMRLRN